MHLPDEMIAWKKLYFLENNWFVGKSDDFQSNWFWNYLKIKTPKEIFIFGEIILFFCWKTYFSISLRKQALISISGSLNFIFSDKSWNWEFYIYQPKISVRIQTVKLLKHVILGKICDRSCRTKNQLGIPYNVCCYQGFCFYHIFLFFNLNSFYAIE